MQWVKSKKTYLCIKSSNYYSLWFKSAGTILIQASHQSRHGLRHAGTKSSETPNPIQELNEEN
jgi:hypothetical protein